MAASSLVRRATFNLQRSFDFLFERSDEGTKRIRQNLEFRKSNVNADELLYEIEYYKQQPWNPIVRQKLKNMLWALPNFTSPTTPFGDASNNVVLFEHAVLPEFDCGEVCSAEQYLSRLNQLRLENVAAGSGRRTYYLMGDCSKLENALLQYALDFLRARGFQYISVPECLPADVMEACGFPTNSYRSQVYKLADGTYTGGYDPLWFPYQCNDDENEENMRKKCKVCLTGTSEMGIASFVSHVLWPKLRDDSTVDRMWKFCSLNRCYRKEVPSQETALYRTHQFYKVEMFIVCEASESCREFERLVEIQKDFFTSLQLPIRVLELASEELGLPAYRKVDVECFMPSEEQYGEISSCSNCTDFQSRRLGMQPLDESSEYMHTLNGTGCAVTRTMKGLVENNVDSANNCIHVPKVLWPYMFGVKKLCYQTPEVDGAWILTLKG